MLRVAMLIDKQSKSGILSVMERRKFTLTEAEQQELRQAYEACKDGEQRTRLQAVRLYGTGWSVDQIMEVTGCSRRSLLRWCHDYRQGGVKRLADQRNGGNHTLLDDAQRAMIEQKLEQYTPRDLFGADTATADGAYWTVPDLRRAVEQWTDVVYRANQSYRELFADCGFSYQRTERQYRSRKEADVAAFSELVEKNSPT
jgi:transposase